MSQEDHKLEASLDYRVRPCLKKQTARHQWLTPKILDTQKAKIMRIVIQSQPRQILRETLP
jgi:hypothetical protein